MKTVAILIGCLFAGYLAAVLYYFFCQYVFMPWHAWHCFDQPSLLMCVITDPLASRFASSFAFQILIQVSVSAILFLVVKNASRGS